MNNDQEFFELFKEAGDQLTERPSEQTWRRLEGRLEKNRRNKRQKPDFLPGTTVAALIFLLFVAALVGWFVTKEHEACYRADKAFEEMKSLQGVWESKTRQTVETLNWVLSAESKSDTLLQGAKYIYFQDTTVFKGQIILRKTPKSLYFTTYDSNNHIEQTFELIQFAGRNAVFLNKRSHSEARFVFLKKDEYSIQTADGNVFIFSKSN